MCDLAQPQDEELIAQRFSLGAILLRVRPWELPKHSHDDAAEVVVLLKWVVSARNFA